MTAPRRDDSRQARGKAAEQAAARFLAAKGLHMLTRNYRCRLGELDMVMRDGNSLVFVEVRYRRRSDFGSAVDSVDARKRGRLVAAARHYLAQQRLPEDTPCRFDVIAISPAADNDGVEWVRNAFDA
jgi:putative endonuclease